MATLFASCSNTFLRDLNLLLHCKVFLEIFMTVSRYYYNSLVAYWLRKRKGWTATLCGSPSNI